MIYLFRYFFFLYLKMSASNYDFDKELGRGTFGVTYLAYDKIRKQDVAVKTIDIAKSKKLGADLNEINEEIKMLKDLSGKTCNEYVACYYDHFQDKFNGVDTIFIVSEYIKGGSLTKFIQDYKGKVPVNILWSLYTQLLIGLKFIHDSSYAHRDIKPDNILITDDLVIKYIDFGLSCLDKCREDACLNTCKGRVGTLVYEPPEFFRGRYKSSLEMAQLHDIWAISMVMFEMAHGDYKFPYQAVDSKGELLPTEELERHIMQAPEPGYQPQYNLDDGRTNEFLNTIIVNNVEERPDVNQASYLLLSIIFAKVYQQKRNGNRS